MEEVDREISEMKLSLNARARTVAESYLTAVSSTLPATPREESNHVCSSTHEHEFSSKALYLIHPTE